MPDTTVYPVHKEFAEKAHIDLQMYRKMYHESISDPDIFWSRQAELFLDWKTPWNQVASYDFDTGKAVWFAGSQLNVTVNCIDRHLVAKSNHTAIIWEGDNPNDSKIITYQNLSDQVNKLANVLKSRNVKKGDRVCIYMPMIPEATYAMLACARIGEFTP